MNAKSPHPRAGEGSSTPSTHSSQARTALLLDLLELRLDDVFLVFRLAVTVIGVGARRRTARVGSAATARLRRLRVHRLGELVRRAGEGVRRAADLVGVLRLERLLRVRERALDVALGGRVERRAVLGERALGLIDEAVELVAGVDELPLLAVLLGVGGRLLDHAVHFLLRE